MGWGTWLGETINANGQLIDPTWEASASWISSLYHEMHRSSRCTAVTDWYIYICPLWRQILSNNPKLNNIKTLILSSVHLLFSASGVPHTCLIFLQPFLNLLSKTFSGLPEVSNGEVKDDLQRALNWVWRGVEKVFPPHWSCKLWLHIAKVVGQDYQHLKRSQQKGQGVLSKYKSQCGC